MIREIEGCTPPGPEQTIKPFEYSKEAQAMRAQFPSLKEIIAGGCPKDETFRSERIEQGKVEVDIIGARVIRNDKDLIVYVIPKSSHPIPQQPEDVDSV